MVVPFLAWVAEGAGVRRFEDLDVGLVRAYRAELATRRGKKHGRPLQARTVLREGLRQLDRDRLGQEVTE